jgi:hypothetical protein
MRRPRAFSKPAPPSDKPLRHLQRQKELGLTEAHIQQTVTQFLELDGWRAIRTDPVSDRARGKGFGEIGMPDYLYLRYGSPVFPRYTGPDGKDESLFAQVLWIEFKAPGKAAKPHQLAWHVAERQRGALVLVVDDIDSFRQWYAQSGLQRR